MYNVHFLLLDLRMKSMSLWSESRLGSFLFWFHFFHFNLKLLEGVFHAYDHIFDFHKPLCIGSRVTDFFPHIMVVFQTVCFTNAEVGIIRTG